MGGFIDITALPPIGMPFTARTMLCMILDDNVLAIEEQGKERKVTMALLRGFVLMMIQDKVVAGQGA